MVPAGGCSQAHKAGEELPNVGHVKTQPLPVALSMHGASCRIAHTPMYAVAAGRVRVLVLCWMGASLTVSQLAAGFLSAR